MKWLAGREGEGPGPGPGPTHDGGRKGGALAFPSLIYNSLQ